LEGGVYAATRQEIKPKYLRYAAAEEYTGLGRTTLTKLVRDGEVRTAKLGKAVLINRESIDEYLESQSS
jgi:excisionase family DNA binding protein